MSDKKRKDYTGILTVIIVLLFIIIAEVFYFSTKDTKVISSGDSVVSGNDINTDTDTAKVNTDTAKVVDWKKWDSNTKKIDLVIISDKNCKLEICDTAPIVTNLKKDPSLANAAIKVLDYSEAEAKKILSASKITKLPAILLSDTVEGEIKKYLQKTPDGKYSLSLGASYDPTVDMKKVIADIKKNSYIKWNKGAKITWIEYSDLECPFCAKLHNSGTPEALEKKYGDKLNTVFQSFPLDFHKNALPAAEAIECLAKQKGGDAYYKLMKKSFTDKNSNLSFLVDEAVKLWADKASLEKCIEAKSFSAKIDAQQKGWSNYFGITGTPWNVLINNETGEYEVISGAYPTEEFIKIIDKLLK